MSPRTLLCMMLCGLAPTTAPAAEVPPGLSVLFLGDQGHHVPARRFAQLGPVLAGRGINATYTEALSDLNPANLARYDALVIYANIEAITPAAEAALVEYVEGGGGFVPLHCASFCFLNSAPYIKLVGAQFARHGTGEFDTKVVDPGHPIMKGLEPFRTWDETYVHAKHNAQGRQVLQVRAEGDAEEPWTWTRTQGKGRVFYTAYGHDHRTWEHPGFHDLVERGIRWASGKGPVVDGRPRVATGLEPFEFEQAGDKIPNYVAGAKWGVQAESSNRMQKPLSPERSMAHYALPEGFTLSLFAAEPQIKKPVALAWDHRGRLWVAETFDYPNEKQPEGKGRDRISICEDTDGDGRADKFTVFADGLSIPTSLTFANGGIVVHQPPETLFLKDTDGDDRADVRTVLFSGWNTADTHAGPSNLKPGLDNWIYGMVGYSGFKGKVGGEDQEFRTGFYRLKADGSEIEFLRSTNNNSWGVGFSEEGLLFGSTANNCPSVYLPIPNRFYEAVRGWSPRVLQSIADDNRFFPATANVRQMDWHGGFTAAAGHALYTARAYPPHYWNKVAFVTEPTGHLVSTFSLETRGADFASHNSWNLLASDDEWSSPIAAEVGPDGNVWVIDWYNYIVQHNPTPQGFKTGKGNAYETPLRDKTHGRVYRVISEKKPSVTPAPLDPADGPGLVAALARDNMFWRQHAQRLLVERGKTDVVPALVALLEDRTVDAVGLNPGAIHALWTLQGLNALEGAALEAASGCLAHPSAGVRRNAALALAKGKSSADRIVAAGLLADPDPQVRLAALLALAEAPSSDAAAHAVVDALANGRMSNDPWLTDASVAAAAAHDLPFLNALAAHRFDRDPASPLPEVARRVAEHVARGEPTAKEIGGLLAALTNSNPKLADAVALGLAAGWPKTRSIALDAKAEADLGKLLPILGTEARGPLVAISGRWGVKSLDRFIKEIADGLLATVRDEARPDAARLAAARQLIELSPADAGAATAILDLVTPGTSPELAAGLVEALAKADSPAVGVALAGRLGTLTPAAVPPTLRALLGRADWTGPLLDAIARGDIPASRLALDQRQALASHPDRTLAERARTLLADGGGLPDPDRQKVIDALGPLVLKAGNAGKGKDVFKQHCAKCHTHAGEGGKVGPDLTGMAVHPKEELLIHILDPSRSVEGNFIQYSVATKDGRVLNGLLAGESKAAVELIDAEGKNAVVLRADIDALAASKKSIMPEGFEKQVTPEALADLLEFLTGRGKYVPLDLRKAATAVSTQGMFYDKASPVERLIFADWSPKVVDGVPFALVDPMGDRVPNVVLLYGPQGTIPPTMPRSVSLACRTPARALHLLGAVSGWGAGGPDAPHTVSMIVRLHYADGKAEDHPLLNGVHLADYIRRVDVPGSKFALNARSQQVRTLSIVPGRSEPLDHIELIKGPDDTAPVVLAITVETK
ncbi:ThuA domain-containing protein [Isosphaeraceae bacterium EP7]